MHSKHAVEVLISEAEIASKVSELGRRIAQDYADKSPIIVTTLKGAVIFSSDLVRHILPTPKGMTMEFIRASSYGSGTVSSGNVRLEACTLKEEQIKGSHLLLVEDIVDSGRTGVGLIEYFKSKGCASVRMISLLSKPSRREVHFEPDYLGFTIEDKFVVGYGLDFDQQYRSLPFIGVYDPTT